MVANMDHIPGSQIFPHWEKTTASRDSTVNIFARMLAYPDRSSAVVAFWKRVRPMTMSTAADSSAILADFQTLGSSERLLLLKFMEGRYQCLRDLAYRKASTEGGEAGKIAIAFESSLPPSLRSVIGRGRYKPCIDEWVLERMRELPSARTEEELEEQETRFQEVFFDQVPDDNEDDDEDSDSNDGGPYHGSVAADDSDVSMGDSDDSDGVAAA
ncbi:hypothetical protein B0T22DRAFT_512512 [Podospora appendiculata]|uniref:Uncharacterized protein n=1 Tax=Podospora appendiculata TaxID=314037 RepID=A0AAE0XA22_9PEZI|nr:hypothetical protein B0T22DRAFT_512512 [Podospora appendiculata]